MYQLNNVIVCFSDPWFWGVVQVTWGEVHDLPVSITIVTIIWSRVDCEVGTIGTFRFHIERVELFCTLFRNIYLS